MNLKCFTIDEISTENLTVDSLQQLMGKTEQLNLPHLTWSIHQSIIPLLSHKSILTYFEYLKIQNYNEFIGDLETQFKIMENRIPKNNSYWDMKLMIQVKTKTN